MVASVNVSFPPINIPMVDPKTGIMSTTWYQFFESITQRTGGANDQVAANATALSNTVTATQLTTALGPYAKTDVVNEALGTKADALSTTAALNALHTEVDGKANQTALDATNTNLGNKADRTTRITAGNGLNGGGTLNGDMTLNADQDTGWTIGTGTPNKAAFAAYAGQTLGAAYVQANAQTTDDAVKANAERILAIEEALRANGAID